MTDSEETGNNVRGFPERGSVFGEFQPGEVVGGRYEFYRALEKVACDSYKESSRST